MSGYCLGVRAAPAVAPAVLWRGKSGIPRDAAFAQEPESGAARWLSPHSKKWHEDRHGVQS